ncbi:hypothetical protein LEMLEM_LOCUS17199 [Lemmus lemmus]
MPESQPKKTKTQ